MVFIHKKCHLSVKRITHSAPIYIRMYIHAHMCVSMYACYKNSLLVAEHYRICAIIGKYIMFFNTYMFSNDFIYVLSKFIELET
jgi:hypothetical protein